MNLLCCDDFAAGFRLCLVLGVSLGKLRPVLEGWILVVGGGGFLGTDVKMGGAHGAISNLPVDCCELSNKKSLNVSGKWETRSN